MRHLLAIATLGLLAGCRPESRADPHRAVAPPVDSPSAIPAAPISGTIRGAPFVARDARYVIDRRIGYAHTDIKLSAGKADLPCGPILPANASSIWLRLDGAGKIESQDMRIAEDAGAWSVHYQVFDGAHWVGVSDASAVLSMHEPGPDGRIQGGLAVCFSDDAKSCVSGSFTAESCPTSIDQPVRGAQPPETIPEKYRLIVNDAAAAVGR